MKHHINIVPPAVPMWVHVLWANRHSSWAGERRGLHTKLKCCGPLVAWRVQTERGHQDGEATASFVTAIIPEGIEAKYQRLGDKKNPDTFVFLSSDEQLVEHSTLYLLGELPQGKGPHYAEERATIFQTQDVEDAELRIALKVKP